MAQGETNYLRPDGMLLFGFYRLNNVRNAAVHQGHHPIETLPGRIRACGQQSTWPSTAAQRLRGEAGPGVVDIRTPGHCLSGEELVGWYLGVCCL